MTKREKAQIQKAIEMIMSDDGGFEKGIGILCRLIGWEYPAANVTSKPISIFEIVGEGKEKE